MVTAVEPQLPVTVFTGFLGSGKTTLLSKLLARPGMGNAAVIINEFGEIPLDHLLVARPREDAVLLRNGCLCCEVRGDLVETLTALLVDRAAGRIPCFDRVLVETSGLADPVPVLLTVTAGDALPRWYRMDGVITLVDAVNGAGQLDSCAEPAKQVMVADRLLLTKTDLADRRKLPALRARLRHLNPVASLHDVVAGEIDPALLFDLHPHERAAGPEAAARWLGFETLERHDGAVRCFAIRREGTIHPAALRLWVDMLAAFRGPDLLRVKGLLDVDGEPVVIHAVQHLFHPPVPLPAWPDRQRGSRLVFITRGIPREAIERTLTALDFVPDAGARPGAIDPESYARFVRAVGGFMSGQRDTAT